jgi:hypothetical protein
MTAPVPPTPYAANSKDTGSFGWSVLGFFIPIVGLILWLVWKNDRPKDSIKSRNGFIAGIIFGVVISIIMSVVSAMLFSAYLP